MKDFEYVTSNLILTEEIIPDIVGHDNLSLDIETRGLDYKKSQILLVQIGTPARDYVLDARKLELEPLFKILEQTNPLIIGHNLKFDLTFLRHYYNYKPKRLFDTMVAYGVIYNGIRNPFVSLSRLTREFLDIELPKDIRNSFIHTYGNITQEQIEYAASDIKYLPDICRILSKKLMGDNLIETARLEFKVIPAVVSLEYNGFRLDTDKWASISDELVKRLSDIEIQIAKLVNGTMIQGSFLNTPTLSFNLRSPQQVKKIFSHFGIDLDSTKNEVIGKIDHPFARALIEHRRVSKLITTYGVKFLEHVQDDGRIHATFNQMGAMSGRFSSSRPNLQNIPRSELYRHAFIADPDNFIISADYSQIELRVAAIMSGEQVMIDEYLKPDADLHRLTASRIYKVPTEQVTPAQRQIGKNCNFGAIYGISKYGMYYKFNIPINEAEFLLDGFRKAYPTLFDYMMSEADKGVRHGFNTTKIGRRRYYTLPDVNDPEYFKKIGRIKREASNTAIQGTAADIIKTALAEINNKIEPFNAKLVNTVHDEVEIETPRHCASQVNAQVYDCMVAAAEEIMGTVFDWPVHIEIGETWSK